MKYNRPVEPGGPYSRGLKCHYPLVVILKRNCDKNRCVGIDSQRKNANFKAANLVIAIVFAAAIAAGPAVAGRDKTSRADYVWHDQTTGFALSGYDPVSYFGPNGPQTGVKKNEYTHEEVVWRFVNQGNLKAFRRYPEAYLPRFGGFDTFGMSQGYTVEPNPEIWQIIDGKLFLFRSREARSNWLKDRKSLQARARENWRKISAGNKP